MDFELTAEEIGTHNQWVVDVAQAAQRKLWKAIKGSSYVFGPSGNHIIYWDIWQQLEAALGEK